MPHTGRMDAHVPRLRRTRLARLTDDPGFARAFSRLLTDQRTALPPAAFLDQFSVVSSADARRAARLWTEAVRQAGPDQPPLEALVAIVTLRLRQAARLFRADGITVAQWMTEHLGHVKLAQAAAALAAYGGTAQMTPARWLVVRQAIRQQLAFCGGFFADVVDGRQRRNGRLDARAGLYAGAARTTHTAITRRLAYEAGATYERNILGTHDNCRECGQQADLGWVPIGTLSAPGTRTCLSNCSCTLSFSHVASRHEAAS